jgi:hypothetical protein
MILRRLVEGFRRQDWFTVIVEFLVVVGGIFIGLQVDDWNRTRLQKAEEAEYLARLADDLRHSIVESQVQIDWMSDHAGRGKTILAALDSCHIPEDEKDEFANSLYHLGKVAPTYLVRGTIAELRSTGKQAILSSVEIRREINSVIQFYEDERDTLLDIRGRLAPQVNYVDSKVGIRVEGPIGGIASIKFDDLIIDLDELCSDRRFYLAIAAATNYTWDAIERSIRVTESVERLADFLENET